MKKKDIRYRDKICHRCKKKCFGYLCRECNSKNLSKVGRWRRRRKHKK